MSSVQFSRREALCGVFAITFVAAANAVEPSALEFSRNVQPILSKHCFVCHGPDESSRQAGLRLDLRLAATAELESGAVAILPGQPEASELLRRVTAEDADTRMPPAAHGPTLSPSDVKTLADWIAAGAAYEDHWSFRRLHRVEPPAVEDEAWVRNSIDRFILARLESEGLTPSPETLLACRRRRRRSPSSRPIRRQTHMIVQSTDCWPRPTLVSAGDGIGLTWRTTPTATAT